MTATTWQAAPSTTVIKRPRQPFTWSSYAIANFTIAKSRIKVAPARGPAPPLASPERLPPLLFLFRVKPDVIRLNEGRFFFAPNKPTLFCLPASSGSAT